MKIIPICFFLVMGWMTWAWAAGPDETVAVLEKSVGRAARAGLAAENWQAGRGELIQEILDLELKEAWTLFQLEKTRRYIESEKKNIAVLEKNLDRAGTIRDSLTPFLEVLYLDLESHVKNDLPFALAERQRRLAFIRSYLDDPAAGLSDKFGRMLEAMQVESEYGYSVDVTQEIARDIEGGPAQVTLFRLGRLGLFRVLANNSRVQRYHKDSRSWQDIAGADTGELNKAMDIAGKKRVATMVTLPVGRHSTSEADMGDRK